MTTQSGNFLEAIITSNYSAGHSGKLLQYQTSGDTYFLLCTRFLSEDLLLLVLILPSIAIIYNEDNAETNKLTIIWEISNILRKHFSKEERGRFTKYSISTCSEGY